MRVRVSVMVQQCHAIFMARVAQICANTARPAQVDGLALYLCRIYTVVEVTLPRTNANARKHVLSFYHLWKRGHRLTIVTTLSLSLFTLTRGPLYVQSQ